MTEALRFSKTVQDGVLAVDETERERGNRREGCRL